MYDEFGQLTEVHRLQIYALLSYFTTILSFTEQTMKETFHICHSSHDEVMFRSEEDLIIGFNYLAVTALENDSALLADGFLSTHHHEVVRTDGPIALGRRNRYSYTRYFNSKYHRKGSLGENHIFTLKIDGLYHTQALLNYVLKQGLHHGLATTAFGYRHGSANSVFRNDLGKTDAHVLLEERKRHLFLPSNTKDATVLFPKRLFRRTSSNAVSSYSNSPSGAQLLRLHIILYVGNEKRAP